MVYRGVVARVSLLEGRKIVGEALRFIPLMRGDTVLTDGDKRLRVTRARKGEVDPELLERELEVFLGRTVAIEATEYDDVWIYGCVDITQHQV